MSCMLSVIVPVYNVENYLDRCIKSILAQDYKYYELILINDGSTDSSGKICDYLSDKYSFIKTIHKKNSGLSSARNTGIDISTGEYVVFIDSDDYIEKDMFKYMMSIAEKENLDILICNHNDEYNGKIKYKEEINDFYCDGKEAIYYMLEGKKIPGTACAKFIKRTFLNKNKFMIGRNYEDAMFNTELFLNVNNVFVTGKRFYVYYHRENSITTEKYTPKALDIIYAYDYVYDLVMKKIPDLREVLDFRRVWARCVVYDRMVVSDIDKNNKDYRKIKDYIKKRWFKIVRCKYFTVERRLAICLFKINEVLYKKLLKNKKG